MPVARWASRGLRSPSGCEADHQASPPKTTPTQNHKQKSLPRTTHPSGDTSNMIKTVTSLSLKRFSSIQLPERGLIGPRAVGLHISCFSIAHFFNYLQQQVPKR